MADSILEFMRPNGHTVLLPQLQTLPALGHNLSGCCWL